MTPAPPSERGQAMLIVVMLMAVLALVPVSAQLLALNQLPATTETKWQQEALEAARAGLSDWVNRVQTVPDYLSYCSPVFCTGGTVDSANPAFAASPGGDSWARLATLSGAAVDYQYVVDTEGVNPQLPTAQTAVVFSTGRVGDGPRAVSQTVKAVLSLSAGGISLVTDSCLTVPSGVASYKVVAYGAEGGGGQWDATGGDGSEVVAYPPVSPGDTLCAGPGQPGAAGNAELAGLDVYGEGGPGGFSNFSVPGVAGVSLTLDLSGGSGGGNGPVLNVLDTTGGGGGGGTALFDTSSPTPLVVAGGGGGGGGGELPALGLGTPGDGGWWPLATPTTAAGQSASGVLNPGAGGAAGGATSATGGVGGTGSGLLGLATGQGGGGGGGAGGSAGGTCVPLAGCVAGAGGGGGSGASYAQTATGCPAPSVAPAVYPVGDTTGAGEVVLIPAGGSCGAEPLPQVTAELVEVVTPGSDALS